MNDQNHSVTQWIEAWRQGDDKAAFELWNRYFQPLVRLARRRLQDFHHLADAPEDVALSAFDAFCRATRKGRYPDLQDRESLWRVLIRILQRKANDAIAREMAEKRGGGRTRGDSALGTPGIGGVEDSDSGPDCGPLVAEEFQKLLDSLDDARMVETVQLSLEGREPDEIAKRFEVAPATVRRWLRLVYAKLSEQ
jgi:DNA-directed RNA polymerase specialized sigma24 family protein